MSEKESNAMVEQMRKAAKRTQAALDEESDRLSAAHVDAAPTDDAHVGKTEGDKDKARRRSADSPETASAHITSAETNVEPNVKAGAKPRAETEAKAESESAPAKSKAARKR